MINIVQSKSMTPISAHMRQIEYDRESTSGPNIETIVDKRVQIVRKYINRKI